MDSFLIRCDKQEGELLEYFRRLDPATRELMMLYVQTAAYKLAEQAPKNLVRIPTR